MQKSKKGHNSATTSLTEKKKNVSTPQPLYNTVVELQAKFHVSYAIRVILRVKGIDYIGKEVLNNHLGSNPDPSYIQKRVRNEPCYKGVQVYFYFSCTFHVLNFKIPNHF